MKVLIIGANGYVGNVVAERAKMEGWSVVASTRSFEARERLRKQGMQAHVASLEEPGTLLPIIQKVDAVVYSAYGYNDEKNALKELSTGISHISGLLKCLHNTGKLFVLTSGSGVYPDTGERVPTEETPLPPTEAPITMARRKLEAEVIDAANHGVRSVVFAY